MKKETIILPIQINGKRKTEISVTPDLSEEDPNLVLEEEIIKKAILNTELKRFIYVPKRIKHRYLKGDAIFNIYLYF